MNEFKLKKKLLLLPNKNFKIKILKLPLHWALKNEFSGFTLDDGKIFRVWLES